MMNRIYETTIKGFGLNIWSYETDDDEVSKFIEAWGENDDPIDAIDQAMDNNDLLCEPFFNSDAVYLYFDDDAIKRRSYTSEKMRTIIRDTFIHALWLVYKEGEHSEPLDKVEFMERCREAITTETMGHELNVKVEEML